MGALGGPHRGLAEKMPFILAAGTRLKTDHFIGDSSFLPTRSCMSGFDVKGGLAVPGPWGRWAGWWAGLWRDLRWVKLPLLTDRCRDDGIEFFIRGVRLAIPGLSGTWLRETATVRARLGPSVASACPRPLVATLVPV